METGVAQNELRHQIDEMFERLDKEFGALVLLQAEVLEMMEAQNDSTE